MRFKYLNKGDTLFLEAHISRLCQFIDNRAKAEQELKYSEEMIKEIQQQIYEIQLRGYPLDS